jgi:hypothetical protein
MDHDLDGNGCPKQKECANAGAKCGYCRNLNCFKSGSSTGKGQRHEKKIVKAINTRARLRGGSGSAAHAKGDVIDDGALFEGKSGYAQVNSKGQKTFTLKRHWLTKIENEALAEGRMPVLAIHFDGAPDDEIWAIVRLEVLQDLRTS